MIRKRSMFSMIAVLTATMMLLSACGQTAPSQNTSGSAQNQSEAKTNGKLQVFTSFYPLYYVATRIGGEYVDVKNIVPAGVEPHDFEPTAKDIVDMSKANLFIYNGSGFEAWVEKALQGFDQSQMTVVKATDGLQLLKNAEEQHNEHAGESAEAHDHGEFDPHVWLDPTLLKAQAEKVKDALAKKDQAHAAEFGKNYEKLAADLDTLDNDFKKMVAAAPRKEFMVSHRAFGYLAHHYGLEQIAISGVSPADEPTPADLKELVERVKEHHIQYILFETLVSTKVADVIARETGAKTAMLNPLEGLTEADQQAGKDYLSIMRDNLETLKTALQ
ncbi:metal ABC transporter substrate-binding protein [Brevibacillus fluminis]|uniref:metal ABC transporter substrate-binding protein n=1 Tax=Brevibacillus fluminis TaxID=511487 RepID=UPI003F8BBEAF